MDFQRRPAQITILALLLLACGPKEAGEGKGSKKKEAAAKRPPVEILEPNKDQTWQIGSVHAIKWKAIQDAGSSFRVELIREGRPVVALPDAYHPKPDEPGFVEVTIPPNVPGAPDYAIRLTSTWSLQNPQIFPTPLFGDSRGKIKIDDSRIATPVQILAPSGDVTWAVGSTQEVHWRMDLRSGTSAKLELFRGDKRVADLGTAWSELAEDTTRFKVPDVERGGGYKVRVTSTWTLEHPEKYPEPFFEDTTGSITIN